MSKTDLTNTVEWNEINWRKAEKSLFKLQKRIYQASLSGNVRKVRKLQKTLLNSFYAKLIAVRKVTQDNSGKKTAGVDGIKSLSPKQRLILVNTLKIEDKSKPIRRVWIPKNNGKKRPLGIPVMRDRAKQTLLKLALEPEWEAKFEPNSYGFRPGRNCHDAIEAIFKAINSQDKYVLDADISKCFDKINHTKLLNKTNTFPKARRQIKAWLKAGILDKGNFSFPKEGTPQGGSISPLLANIALHGMETRIKEYAATWKGDKRTNLQSISLTRYADDFVIIHKDQNVIKECKKIIGKWLSDIGLELNEDKTRISHTLNEYNGNIPGFDFLGFNIRQYPKGIHHTGKKPNGKPLGFKTLIKPSKEAFQKHYDKLAQIIDNHKAAPQHALIGKLNPIIIGWTNYYKAVSSKETFTKMYHLLHKKLGAWADRRHPKKNKTWVCNKYWQTVGNNKWVFKCKYKNNQYTLLQHPDVEITYHVKVRGTDSPYNGNTNYWATRMGKHPEVRPTVARLLRIQKGKCNFCNLTFQPGDKIEIDHITPQKAGGHKYKNNLQVLHRHCHDSKTREDLILIKKIQIRKRVR